MGWIPRLDPLHCLVPKHFQGWPKHSIGIAIEYNEFNLHPLSTKSTLFLTLRIRRPSSEKLNYLPVVLKSEKQLSYDWNLGQLDSKV